MHGPGFISRTTLQLYMPLAIPSSYKMFKIALLIMGHFFNGCNTQTFESLSQNFCLNLGTSGVEDNLSCPSIAVHTGNCFPFGSLCDGVRNCPSGIDEGESLPTLVCGKHFIFLATSNYMSTN